MTQLYPDDCDADVYLKKNIFSQEGSSCFYEGYKCYRMLSRNSAVKNEKSGFYLHTKPLHQSPPKSQFDLGSGGFGNITEWATFLKKIK